MDRKIDIVVAEDEYFTLEGICSLLEKESDFTIVGRANSGEQALRLVKQTKPQVLLLDIRMPPGMDGIEVIRRLRQSSIQIAIVALTQEYQLIQAVKQAGANGYVPKDHHHMFIPTIRCVAETGSQVFINPKLSQTYQEIRDRVDLADLSELEYVVWKLMGYKNEEIARRLEKSAGRIRNLISDLYCKLGIEDDGRISRRVRAMEWARLLGILEDPEV